eukprot:1161018-Pelagomonas_calceolata.AAC.1
MHTHLVGCPRIGCSTKGCCPPGKCTPGCPRMRCSPKGKGAFFPKGARTQWAAQDYLAYPLPRIWMAGSANQAARHFCCSKGAGGAVLVAVWRASH